MEFSDFDAVLLDLDGTLYHEDQPLPGAAELVNRLARLGQPLACISNSTTSPDALANRLAGMGMAVPPARIYTAAAAAADYVIARFGPRPRVFNLATEGVQQLLEGRADWASPGDERCDAVIVGAPTNSHAGPDRQVAALRLLRSGAALVGICNDRVYPSPRGIEFGSGAFTAMLAYASGAVPVFCGKPEPVFFAELCRRIGVDPARCLLIGDNLESDIAGGNAMGMATALVLTGVASRRDLELAPADRRPRWVFDDLLAVLGKPVSAAATPSAPRHRPA
jgi:HAD superfamily hydrolase (TIGR01450 family)